MQGTREFDPPHSVSITVKSNNLRRQNRLEKCNSVYSNKSSQMPKIYIKIKLELYSRYSARNMMY